MWVHPTGNNSPWTAPVWVTFPWGMVLQAQSALVRVPHGVTSPTNKLFQCGLFSPQVPRSLPRAFSSTGFQCVHSIFSSMGLLHSLQVDLCTSINVSGRLPASPWASSCAAEESHLWQLEHLLLFLLLCWPWCLQGCFCHTFSACSSRLQLKFLTVQYFFFFFSFLNMLPQKCYCHSLLAWSWPAACPSWSWLALVLLDMGESIWQLLTETPFLSLLPKPGHTRPIQKPKRRGSVYGLNWFLKQIISFLTKVVLHSVSD